MAGAFPECPEPIIALANNPWHGARMSRQQILSRLGSRGWNVVYSTGALSVWDMTVGHGNDRLWQAAGWRSRAERIDHVRVDTPGRLLLRYPGCPPYDGAVIRKHVERLRRLAGLGRKRGGIAYIFIPDFWPYVEWLNCSLIVYHAPDIVSKMPNRNPRIVEWEQALVERADFVVGASDAIIRELPGRGPAIGRVLPNGADAALFHSRIHQPVPEDLRAIPSPRIGYIGAINLKVDTERIGRLAILRPDWHWALVGPIKDDGTAGAAAGLNVLKRLPNVHFLGNKPYAAVPSYAAHMDVNTMCYRQQGDGWWLGISPLKLFEYLAVGKPIVSSDVEAVRSQAHLIHIAHTDEDWLHALQIALTTGGPGTPDQRIAAAFDNSWDHRVSDLENLIRQHTEQNT
jgi:glycosyltransferase involved in cell wall biosynthesis